MDSNNTLSNEPLRPALVPEANKTTPQVCLDCGDFGLFIPASDLVSLTIPQQVLRRTQDATEACGSVIFQEDHYSIFCFNQALQLTQEFAQSHTAIALLRCENYHFGIACYTLTKVEDEQAARYKVPPSMFSRRQPFTEFMIINNRVWGLSSAALLLSVVQNLLKASGACLQPKTSSDPSIRRGASS